jgi:hypothetical protein
MTALTRQELESLGYRVVDGKAIRVGSGTQDRQVGSANAQKSTTATAATASPYRSKTEAAYAARLEIMQLAGSIRDWRYEAVRLRLADRVRFTPDFRVVSLDGSVALHEVKGAFTREDARIKLQTAATLFPEYRFVLATYAKGGWTIVPVRAA